MNTYKLLALIISLGLTPITFLRSVVTVNNKTDKPVVWEVALKEGKPFYILTKAGEKKSSKGDMVVGPSGVKFPNLKRIKDTIKVYVADSGKTPLKYNDTVLGQNFMLSGHYPIPGQSYMLTEHYGLLKKDTKEGATDLSIVDDADAKASYAIAQPNSTFVTCKKLACAGGDRSYTLTSNASTNPPTLTITDR